MLKSSIKHKVHFFYPYRSYYIKDSQRLGKFIERIFEAEGKRLDTMNYIFCSDKALLAINKEHLNHNYFTDIVTFNLSDKKGSIQAESYISIDRVRANAKHLKVSIRNELLRVIFHGTLHLCGYNDKTTRSIRKMRKKEDYYLSLFLSTWS